MNRLLFDDGGDLIYTTLGERPVGSQRKYIEILRRHFGGRATPSAQFLRAIEGRVALVAGDHWGEWKEAVAAGLPYVVDEHDVVSLRTGAGYAEERAMLEGALAVLFTSEDHRDYLLAQGVKLPPHEVVHLRPLDADLDFEPLPKLPGKHLVYAGAVTDEAQRAGPFGYRTYHQILGAFIRAGWTVHVYTPMRGPVLDELRALGVVLHDFVPHAELYRETSQYTAGLHGYEHDGVPELAASYCDTCRPNKTWDYLAAGIPTICVNGGNSAKVLDGRWGVALRDLSSSELARAEPERLPTITEELRRSQVMEADADRLYALFEDALARAPARSKPVRGFTRDERRELRRARREAARQRDVICVDRWHGSPNHGDIAVSLGVLALLRRVTGLRVVFVADEDPGLFGVETVREVPPGALVVYGGGEHLFSWPGLQERLAALGAAERAIVLPSTFGPFTPEDARLTRDALARHAVAAREPASAAAMAEVLGRDVPALPDPALFLDFAAPIPGALTIYSPRREDDRWMRWEGAPACAPMGPVEETEAFRVYAARIRAPGLIVAHAPFDIPLCEALAAATGVPFVRPGSLAELLELYRTCGSVVTSRFHALVFARLFGKPAEALTWPAHGPKVAAFALWTFDLNEKRREAEGWLRSAIEARL